MPNALHLSERSEVRTNSTASPRRSCPGALLITAPNGRRQLVPAHRAARSCADADCRSRYRRKLFAIARAGIREATADGVVFVKFLTLTLPSPLMVPNEFLSHGWAYRGLRSGHTTEVAPNSVNAYRYMAWAFNRFQTAARRRWTYGYFRVVEEGSAKPYVGTDGQLRVGSERVHYHLLVMSRSFMAQRDLSKIAARAGLGSIVHIEAVRSEKKIARYLTTYATKDGGLSVPHRLRFFVMSRSWAARSRSSGRLRRDMERSARLAEGWRFEYVRQSDLPSVVRALAGDTEGRSPPAAGPDRAALARWSSAGARMSQLDLEAAA